MEIVAGALLRVTVNVNLREWPAVVAKRLATVQGDVLLRALGPVITGWVEVEVAGYRHSDFPDLLFSEPDQQSSVEVRRGVWEPETLRGYVNAQFVVLVDGPGGE